MHEREMGEGAGGTHRRKSKDNFEEVDHCRAISPSNEGLLDCAWSADSRRKCFHTLAHLSQHTDIFSSSSFFFLWFDLIYFKTSHYVALVVLKLSMMIRLVSNPLKTNLPTPSRGWNERHGPVRSFEWGCPHSLCYWNTWFPVGDAVCSLWSLWGVV